MCSVHVWTGAKRKEYLQLAALFAIQWMGLAVWMVPLTLVLNRHGYQVIQPYAFATGALAAFIAPLFFGAMADRHLAPTRVLRWLSVGAALALLLASTAIEWQWNPWLVLGLIQCYGLCSTPTVSISTAIALSRMTEPKREFGPVRALGTIGWIGGCLLVSALGADTSTLAGYCGAALWLGLALFSFTLPTVEPPANPVHLSWQERLGLDALALLKQRDHRVIFLCACLLNIPVAAFYPYTPPQLLDLGFARPAAWMSLAQLTEIAVMFLLGGLLTRWRLKWILLSGLGFAGGRYGLFALHTPASVLVGIMLHGCIYSLFFTTVQIYVNERVEPSWRTRAQALLTVLNSGVGYLIGYLGCGWWYRYCGGPEAMRWSQFWGLLAAAVGLVTGYFLLAYRGRGVRPNAPPKPVPSPNA